MARGKRNNNSKSDGATLGFRATLWTAADKLRDSMDASKYNSIALGLILVLLFGLHTGFSNFFMVVSWS